MLGVIVLYSEAGSHQGFACIWFHPLFPLSLPVSQSLPLKSIPIAWWYHLYIQGWCYKGDKLCLVFSRHSALHSCQRVTFLSHQTTESFAFCSESHVPFLFSNDGDHCALGNIQHSRNCNVLLLSLWGIVCGWVRSVQERRV
jgi:hypothetical protein